jgi:hypothetical protein
LAALLIFSINPDLLSEGKLEVMEGHTTIIHGQGSGRERGSESGNEGSSLDALLAIKEGGLVVW